MRLELGDHVHCTDAEAGELADVVIDPISARVTHLVVGPHHRHSEARLVPIALATSADSGIALACSTTELAAMDRVQESAYLRLGEVPVTDPDWEVGIESPLVLPLYPGMDGMVTMVDPDPHVGVVYDRIPKGEVEVRRASSVTSSDGHHLGHVDGLVVEEELVTGLVLERGHLWGKRDVVIPYAAIERIEDDAVALRLTRDEVGALPSRRVHRWGHS